MVHSLIPYKARVCLSVMVLPTGSTTGPTSSPAMLSHESLRPAPRWASAFWPLSPLSSALLAHFFVHPVLFLRERLESDRQTKGERERDLTVFTEPMCLACCLCYVKAERKQHSNQVVQNPWHCCLTLNCFCAMQSLQYSPH